MSENVEENSERVKEKTKERGKEKQVMNQERDEKCIDGKTKSEVWIDLVKTQHWNPCFIRGIRQTKLNHHCR